MDFSAPLTALSPSLDMRVLAILARADVSYTSGDVARLVGASRSGATLALDRLCASGVVDAETHGRTNSYRLNREHLLADAVLTAAAAGDSLQSRIRDLVADWAVLPERVVLYGSTARGQGGAASDIDLLVIPPPEIDADDPRWVAQTHELQARVARWTGNPCDVLTMSHARWRDAETQRIPVAQEIRRDGISIYADPQAA
ncbi:MAG: nucleotidyltransferase domain-containing protein [Dermatophilus congolensis]|nr:nucleotidyltransferase domain-containing protein [Dermatophilus congolensis]